MSPLQILKLKAHQVRRAVLSEHASLSDVFIVSYPKSGNTRVRFLLANLMKPRDAPPVDFRTVPDYIKRTKLTGERTGCAGRECSSRTRSTIPRTRASSTTSRATAETSTSRTTTTAATAYRKTWRSENSCATTITGPAFGTSTWLDSPAHLLLVRYEDLLSDSERELRRMAAFAGIEASDQQIAEAAAASSFERMKASEQMKNRPFATEDEADRFMRKSLSGKWQEYFGPWEKQCFGDRGGDALAHLGHSS